jgi:xylan 1,4-beta-xylosidase
LKTGKFIISIPVIHDLICLNDLKMYRTYLFVCFVLVLISSSSVASAQTTYRNPVIPGFHPDPSVCCVGDDYYLVTSTFEFFPGVPIFHSKDLVNWEQIGHCLTRASQLPLQKCGASAGIYAPTIRYHDGLFYMVVTNVSGGGNFFVTAKDPAGEWSEPVWVNQGGIDPTIFWDEDGKSYFMSNEHQFSDGIKREGIVVSEIDLKTGKRTTEPVAVWKGTGGRYPEAPHIYKKDGFYYLLIAEGGTEYGHKVTIARSKTIYGPYESAPGNPILTHINRITQTNQIQGTGHADLIEAHDGSWWVVFLAFRLQNGNHHLTGRETYLAPVSWPKNGWPAVNGDGTVALEMTCPTLPLKPFAAKPVRDEFSTAVPGFEWNYLRDPFMDNYKFDSKNSKLVLKGTGLTLNDVDSPTFLGRRQEHINFTTTTSLEFQPSKINEEAGITALMNDRYHFDLIKTKGKVILRYQLGSITHIAKELAVNSDKIQLRIEGSETFYTFSYSTDGIKFISLGKADTNLISTETAGGFTGVYLGLFTSGNGSKCNTPAVFDWFEYKGM